MRLVPEATRLAFPSDKACNRRMRTKQITAYYLAPALVLAAGLATSSALAETAATLVSGFSILADSRESEMESCGIQFRTGIQKLDGSLYIVNGSVNTVFIKDHIPSVLIKVVGAAVANGQTRPVNLRSARLRIGTEDTSHFKQTPGTDPGSILLMQTDGDLSMKWPELTTKLYAGFWITLSGDQISNTTFKVGPFADTDLGLIEEYAECQVAAIQKMEQWITK
jgi:hypothetical protein